MVAFFNKIFFLIFFLFFFISQYITIVTILDKQYLGINKVGDKEVYRM